MNMRLVISLLRISVFVFVISLTQDAYFIEGRNPKAWSFSLGLLVFGWLGILYGYYAWLANPLLLISWLALSKSYFIVGCIASVGALFFALSFLSYKSIVTSELPEFSRITGYGPAYYLWSASALISVFSGFLGLFFVNKS